MQPYQVLMEKLAFGTLGTPARGPGMTTPAATASQAIRRPAMPTRPAAPRVPSVTASATAATSSMQPKPKSAAARKKQAFQAISKMIGAGHRQARKAVPAMARRGGAMMGRMGMGGQAARPAAPSMSSSGAPAQKSAAAKWAAAFAVK